ncbi:hypothetical protein GCM10017687_53260 [Streptomyces echinatus]|uniref:hypothetical protein n=1 Tax=Streptomyces echinatus TaxID=67293 RepID=UPI0031ED516F
MSYPGAFLRVVDPVEDLATARQIAWRHEEEGQRVEVTVVYGRLPAVSGDAVR